MDKATVFSKSAKGRDVVQSGSRDLSMNERRLLIMIDGKMSVATLHQQCAFCSEIEGTLERLLANGYITAPGVAASAASSAPPPALSAQAKSVIEEELVEFLGPIAALLCEEELAQATSIDTVLAKLSAQLDAQQAKQFKDKVFDRLGG